MFRSDSPASIAVSLWETAAGPGDCVPIDLCEVEEYNALMKVDGNLVVNAVQFLKMGPGKVVLAGARGVNLVKTCRANRIPFCIINGLYFEVDSEIIPSSRNCVAVNRAHLARLKKAIGKRRAS